MLWMEPRSSRSASVLAWDEEERDTAWDWYDQAEYLRSGGVDSRDRNDGEDDAYEADERGGVFFLFGGLKPIVRTTGINESVAPYWAK